MKDWNVVISIYQEGFRPALRALREFGPVEPSPYHNVLVMQVEDPIAVLDAVERRIEEDPPLYDAISRIAPAVQSFEFHSSEEFHDSAKGRSDWVAAPVGRTLISRALSPRTEA